MQKIKKRFMFLGFIFFGFQFFIPMGIFLSYAPAELSISFSFPWGYF